MRRLFPVLLCALALFTALTARAQDIDPLLAPHVQTYNSAIADLQKTRKTQVSQSETDYVKKLDAAITGGKDEATIAVLRKEHEGIVKGLLAPANPAGFPPDIAAARKAFFNAANKATLDYNAAKKKVDDAYLKTLAGLAKQAKGKNASPGLAAQVAEEKRRVTKAE